MAENKKWTEEAKREFIHRYERGDSAKSIARRFDLAVTSVKPYYYNHRKAIALIDSKPTSETPKQRTPLVGFSPNRLRELRERASLTIYEVGDKTGLGWSMISAFERGSLPPFEDSSGYGKSPVEKLCEALGCTPDDLTDHAPPVSEPNAPNNEEVRQALKGFRAYLDRVLEAIA